MIGGETVIGGRLIYFVISIKDVLDPATATEDVFPSIRVDRNELQKAMRDARQ